MKKAVRQSINNRPPLEQSYSRLAFKPVEFPGQTAIAKLLDKQGVIWLRTGAAGLQTWILLGRYRLRNVAGGEDYIQISRDVVFSGRLLIYYEPAAESLDFIRRTSASPAP